MVSFSFGFAYKDFREGFIGYIRQFGTVMFGYHELVIISTQHEKPEEKKE